MWGENLVLLVWYPRKNCESARWPEKKIKKRVPVDIWNAHPLARPLTRSYRRASSFVLSALAAHSWRSVRFSPNPWECEWCMQGQELRDKKHWFYVLMNDDRRWYISKSNAFFRAKKKRMKRNKKKWITCT